MSGFSVKSAGGEAASCYREAAVACGGFAKKIQFVTGRFFFYIGEWAPRHFLSLHGGCLVTGGWQRGSNWLIGGCPRSPKPSDCTISDCHSIGPVLSSHCHRLTVRNCAVAAWALEKSCWCGLRARQYPIQAKVGPACKWGDGIGAARSSSWRW